MSVPGPSASWMQKNCSSSAPSPSRSMTSRAARDANPWDVSSAQSCRSGHFASMSAGKNPPFSM